TLGIWNGFDSNATVSSSAVCAPIWGRIMTKCIRLDNKGKLPAADDPRFTFSVPDGVVSRKINSSTGFLSNGEGMDEYFLEDNIPPAMSDTLRFNFYPTRWGYNDAQELD
ncbi:MAG TPA: penicillin-binding protein 1A, partial [Candidatus Cloacimonadota bacterium]|nr:penicillin-binding protein 1A [Candidatus Cloacimonadota bacterium]